MFLQTINDKKAIIITVAKASATIKPKTDLTTLSFCSQKRSEHYNCEIKYF